MTAETFADTLPACMTPDELALWRSSGENLTGNARLAMRSAYPCLDCPRWFAEQMRLVDRCNGEPLEGIIGRPLIQPRIVLVPYSTDEERREARRMSWRESKRRRREAAVA